MPSFSLSFCKQRCAFTILASVIKDSCLNNCFFWKAKGLGYAMNTSEELKFVMDIAAATGVVLDPVYRYSSLLCPFHITYELLLQFFVFPFIRASVTEQNH